MTSSGSILAFFGDAQAARVAFDNLQRAGFRQIALISKKAPAKETTARDDEQPSAPRLEVERPKSVKAVVTLTGAILGTLAHRLVKVSGPLAPLAPALPVMGAIAGGAIGYGVATLGVTELPDTVTKRYQSAVMTGESLLIVRAAARDLSTILEVLRGDGENIPSIFVERSTKSPNDVSKAPLRRDVLPLEQLRELAEEVGRSQVQIAPREEFGGEFLLARLQQNERIINRVVRGLNEAARLDQAVSLSSEWLLDNNYIIQGQIKDVERNLTRKFLKELPTLRTGKYRKVPRLYLMASELISASDSRLDKEHLLEFVHHYQSAGATLTTGELWALPLMLRLALVENLRRLTAQADQRQRERERADYWANRLLAAAFREPDQILPLLAELSKEQRRIAPHFADRLVSALVR